MIGGPFKVWDHKFLLSPVNMSVFFHSLISRRGKHNNSVSLFEGLIKIVLAI